MPQIETRRGCDCLDAPEKARLPSPNLLAFCTRPSPQGERKDPLLCDSRYAAFLSSQTAYPIYSRAPKKSVACGLRTVIRQGGVSKEGVPP